MCVAVDLKKKKKQNVEGHHNLCIKNCMYTVCILRPYFWYLVIALKVQHVEVSSGGVKFRRSVPHNALHSVTWPVMELTQLLTALLLLSLTTLSLKTRKGK